jgi:uncharacterized membrane protein
MTVEERIEAADSRKKEGNALFLEKKFEEAMQQYEMVLNASFILVHTTILIYFITMILLLAGKLVVWGV